VAKTVTLLNVVRFIGLDYDVDRPFANFTMVVLGQLIGTSTKCLNWPLSCGRFHRSTARTDVANLRRRETPTQVSPTMGRFGNTGESVPGQGSSLNV